ncbi:hypothetical protein [Leifsonia xyli]|uniref:hypothetical protein n=1 Tax=Leifsonia xyli TaxID=1575 RepID=UPI003D6745B0
MWDTARRIPFDASLLAERSSPATRARLLQTIARRPGITVDELHAMHLPGLFADLRSFHRAGIIHANDPAPRFYERATRVYPFAD